MKKNILIFLAVLLAALPLFAGQKKEVILRFSQHDTSMRVVLESSDDTVKNANVAASLSAVRIEFPYAVELKKAGDFPFDASVTDRVLLIKLKNTEDISTHKLTAPARIVMDLKLAQKNPSVQAPTAEKPRPLTAADKVAEPLVSPKDPSATQPSSSEKPAQIPKPAAPKPAEPKAAQKPAGTSQPQSGPQTAQPPVAKPAAPKVIVLDPGHGGYDYGLIAKDAKEKDLDLQIAKDLMAALSKLGHKVSLTRKVDQSLSIRERILLANRKTDIFISIHSSASNVFAVYTSSTDEAGGESPVSQYGLAARQGRHIEKSRALAKTLGTSLKTEFRGDVFQRELPLPVLSSMDSAAVLIEYPSLQRTVYDQKMRERVISALVKGIRSYE